MAKKFFFDYSDRNLQNSEYLGN